MKKLLYFGPKGSYTQTAMNKAIELLNLHDYDIEPALRITDIISSVDENPDYIGVIPIENSIQGVVQETVDKLVRTKNYVRIFQEIIIPISHCLSNISGDIEKTEKIISHPQALAQCAGYIRDLSKRNGKHIEVLPVTSTSFAAQSLDNYDETYAAISSEETAKLYNRKVLATQINDEKDNKTRFVCIGRNYPSKTGNDMTSVAFTTVNRPGALVDVLTILKEHNLNMSHIDSRPSKKVLGEYMFYIDVDGHIEEENVKAAFEKIKPYTTFYRLLGAYPKYV
ncbi:MAG: prephenate dehydratase [Candidatus Gastranaerophilales bacterium]|nr:prephenate dehydratase [Candidatus Gastranaerophilales bacterium]